MKNVKGQLKAFKKILDIEGYVSEKNELLFFSFNIWPWILMIINLQWQILLGS